LWGFAPGCSTNSNGADAAADISRADAVAPEDLTRTDLVTVGDGPHVHDATSDIAQADTSTDADAPIDGATCAPPDAPFPMPPGVTVPTGSPAVSAYLDTLAQLHRVACEREVRCCVERSPALCLATPERFAFEPTAGRLAVQLARLARAEMTFDRAAVAPCLDMLARTCAGSFALGDAATPACTNLLHGTLTEGAACLGAEDCAAGLRCRPIEIEAGQACAGTCVPVRAGDPCRGGSCGPLFCAAPSGESLSRCVDIPLVPSQDNRCDVMSFSGNVALYTCPRGTACQYTGLETIFTCRPACTADCSAPSRAGGLGSDCLRRSQCDVRMGLVCNPITSQCALPGACLRDDHCAADERCVDNACVRRAGARPAGADCTRDDECVTNRCARGICTPSGCWS
jgi:hypothetical protein